MRYLRIDCSGVGGKVGHKGPVGCMTGIEIKLEDDWTFEYAKSIALGYIVQELSRYGLDEALRGIGYEPAAAEPTVAVNGRLYAPAPQ